MKVGLGLVGQTGNSIISAIYFDIAKLGYHLGQLPYVVKVMMGSQHHVDGLVWWDSLHVGRVY
jgi:hypothetical protein